MKKFYLLAVFATMLFAQNAICQEVAADPSKLKRIIPPAPDASALGKYGDLPVGLFSGTPEISIPLYLITEGDIQIPIGISYHASGIKVGEIASSVGLGWSLNAGGVVTRSVRGKADESTAGYLNRDAMLSYLHVPFSSITSQAQYVEYEAVAYGNVDMEPDVFAFNFLGRSGTFFFSHDGTIHSQPYENLKIQMTVDFDSCTIRDESGIVYYFTATELSISSNNQPNDDPETFISSWYLSRIIYPDGKTVLLTYSSPVSISQGQTTSMIDNFLINWDYPHPLYGHEECYECEKLPSAQVVLSSQEIHVIKLTSIISSNTKITFEKDTAVRQDFGDYPLKYIKIYSKIDSQLLKQYKFNYSYFGSGSQEYKRLKLDKITELSPTLDTGRIHQFSYEQSYDLPTRNSYAQDHWGYYNGADTNSTLLPRLAGQPAILYSGNRESDSAHMKAGTLKRVEYPTGGSTNFIFQPNQVLTVRETFDNLQAEIYKIDATPGSRDSTTFTIYNTQTCNYSFYSDMGGNAIEDTVPSMEIIRNDTIIRQHNGPGTLVTSVELIPGTYKLRITIPDVPTSLLDAIVYYTSLPVNDTFSRPVGGLRLMKMIDSAAGNPPIVKKFEYENIYFTGPQINNEEYRTNYISRIFSNCSDPYNIWDGPYSEPEVKCFYFSRSSYVKHSLGSIQGGHVGYGKVKTIYGENGENGRTESYFNFEAPYLYGPFPPITPISYEWRNGLLLIQKDFNSQGTLLRRLTNSYDFVTKFADTSFKAGFLYDNQLFDATSEWPPYLNTDQITHTFFMIPVEQVKKTGSSETIYSNGDSITTGTNYYYDNENYNTITRTETGKSNGKTTVSISAYPQDYSSGTAFIDSMMLKNMISAPIENVIYEQDGNGNNKRILKGNIIKLKTKTLVPDTIFLLQTDTSIAQGNYKFSNRSSGVLPPSGSITGFLKDSHYVGRIAFTKYDANGNLIEQQKVDDIRQSYIWDYNFQYPIAEVKNADSASIAYTSFEADGKGNWTFSGAVSSDFSSPTGRKCYFLSNENITKSGLTNTAYIISYWGKGGSVSVNSGSPTGTGNTIGDWTYYEHEITGTSITISGSRYIDEVRLYPKVAQMTTYTYKPLVGMVCQCDANNRISYFEYDGLGRLVLIRDQDKKIIKKICYNYAGLVENCSFFGNSQRIQVFTKNNCGEDSLGSMVPDTIKAGTYSAATQPEADSLAQADLNINGQAYANAHGTCSLIYARMEWSDWYDDLNISYATVWIKFYSDYACTTPYSVSNLSVNYDKVKTFCSEDVLTNSYTVACSGTGYSLGNQIIVKDGIGAQCYYIEFMVTAGTGYAAL